MWTRFYDMHSGGDTKIEGKQVIFIEASEAEAIDIFENTFGHHPDDVTCPCCGENYYYRESDSLEKASRFDRCEMTRTYETWPIYKRIDNPPASMEELEANDEVLIIRAEDKAEA